MAVQIAPHIPFHPAFCTRCQHYAEQIERCRAYITDSTPRPLLGVFSGESEESCAKFALKPITASEAPTESAASAVDSAATTESEAPIPPSPMPSTTSLATATPFGSAPAPEARIHCPKCQHENPPNLLRCSVCGANLLPGESLAFRLSVFVLCLLMAGFCGWLGFALYNQSVNLPEGFNDPFKAIFIAVILPFAGLVMLFRRTPRHTRYANRADRHVSLNLRQAAADYTQALEFAPEKEHAGILRKRAAVYEKLGQTEDATRDQIAVTYAEGAYQTGASFVRLVGGDEDTYSVGRANDERRNLIESGRAVVLGYCPACKDAVQLNIDMRCTIHPHSKPKRVRMVVPNDVADARMQILSGKKRRRPSSQRDRILRLAIILTALAAGFLVIKAFIINPSDTTDEIPESQVGFVEETAPVAVHPDTFSEQGVTFEYPSNWELITETEQRVLLNSTLEGIGEYDYIGGVYLNGADSCPDCAQMTLVVIPLPGITDAMSDEQYADIKANAERSLGNRLLEHQMITIDGIPAASSKYIGKSRENQLWDVMLVAPGAEQAIVFSCSAQPDTYADFEPVFARALESLSFAFSPDVQPLTPPETPTAEPELPSLVAVRVKGNSINVRAGPGTSYAIVGRLAGNSEIQVTGRNAAGDWLNIVDPPGWVSLDLVTLPVAVDTLPVIGN